MSVRELIEELERMAKAYGERTPVAIAPTDAGRPETARGVIYDRQQIVIEP